MPDQAVDHADEAEGPVAAIIIQGGAAEQVAALAARAGVDSVEALRRAVALYAMFVAARERGQRVLFEKDGRVVEPLFHLREIDGSSHGTL